MNGLLAALISAFTALLVAVASNYLTRQKERAAEWRSKKLAYYEEFFKAASGIVGKTAPLPAKIRFADAVNNLHLIASWGVLQALHAFCDEIAESNPHRDGDRHDILWSRLVWEIRKDLNDSPTSSYKDFKARLWASGAH
jgi:hypothetical protein